jgi:parallel beta-helix repeat protein
MSSRLITAVSSIVLLMSAGSVGCAATSSVAHYVSPTGLDTNPGTSAALPFKTFAKAQAAARTSTNKTVYLLGGTYNVTSMFALAAPDAGEVWTNYPGQQPVLNGNGVVTIGIDLAGASNVTINGLTFENFKASAIQAQNVSHVLIENNTVMNTMSTAWVQGGIIAIGTFQASQITHNLVENSNYNGIALAPNTTDSITGSSITNNLVINSCISVSDCGAIYVEDPGQASTGVVIAYNKIDKYGTVSTNSKGIYIDNTASNITVEYNVVYGSGMYGFHINGGHGNLIQNNIFDITGVSAMALYQKWSADTMLNNAFKCNIVYAGNSGPPALWQNIGAGVPPNDNGNLYWGTGGNLPNIGIVDAAPHYSNPNFVNVGAGNYAFAGANPASYCGFAPISMANYGPVAGS